MEAIPKNKVLSEKPTGKNVVSIRRRYVSSLNQVCTLDSNYEFDYALYLDHLYERGEIAGWVRNTTRFFFSRAVKIPRKKNPMQEACVPDFLVFNLDGTYEIHEVKGWMNERSTVVVEQFRADYPNLTYKLISKDELLSLQSQYGAKLWGWVNVR